MKLMKTNLFSKCKSRCSKKMLRKAPSPHYAGGIWKQSFIFTVKPTVHTSPLWKRNFSKTLFKPEEFENADFSFSCGRKTFCRENGAIQKRKRLDNHVNFPQPQIKNDPWLLLCFKNPPAKCQWTENIWCVFRRVKPPFSNFSGAAVWTEPELEQKYFMPDGKVKRFTISWAKFGYISSLRVAFNLTRRLLGQNIVWTRSVSVIRFLHKV